MIVRINRISSSIYSYKFKDLRSFSYSYKCNNNEGVGRTEKEIYKEGSL